VEQGEWVEVARLGRPHGLRGEIFADGEQPSEWYCSLRRVRVRLADGKWFERDGAPTDLKLAEARQHARRLVFRFQGIDSVEGASALVNGWVCVNRAERPGPDEGEFWLADLVGCEVTGVCDGRTYGRIAGWQETGGPVMLEMTPRSGGEPVYIPFVKSICVKVDVTGGRIEIDPPEGLLELNATSGKSAEGRE
jgi:16S rRNA processing protein RimM